MKIRTVRLDDECETILAQIAKETQLSVSDIFKHGLLALRDAIERNARRTPYEIYKTLDLGPGSYATSPSTNIRRALRKAINNKLAR